MQPLTSQLFTQLFLFLLLFGGVWKIFLEWLNKKSAEDGFKKNISQKTIVDPQKAVAYTKAKSHFAMTKITYCTALLALLLSFPVFSESYAWFTRTFDTNPFLLAMYFYGLMMSWQIAQLPFEIYHTFVLEARFGFNTSSFSLFISDKIKEFCVGVVLILPLLTSIFLLRDFFPQHWWWIAATIFIAFQFLIQIIFPLIILPIFFKLTPLKDEKLREELFAFAKKVHFSAKNIFVIDGSRRSKHSNAFFAGMGKSRIIALFDTLIEQLTPKELKAVLAHEIGHYKKKHILRMIFFSIFQIFLGLFFVDWLMKTDFFLPSFGFGDSQPNQNDLLAPTMAIVFFFGSVMTYWLSPLKNFLSRKYEFEADQFACEKMGNHDALVSSLEKLHKENLANLFPHPIYCVFYYSHPTLWERKAAMEKLHFS